MKTRLWLLLVPALVAAGCGPIDEADEPVIDELTGQVLLEATTKYDMHRLLEDTDITGGQWITTAQVQAFLQQNNSFLANYRDPAFSNKTAAALIVERSKAFGISPLYMLARIQVESSLIQSGNSNNLAKATGCGCPDTSGCDAQYVGFGKQIDCSAKKLRGYLTDLDAGRATISGWRVGVTKSTSDPCSVRPANKATAALYTYTPWVGAYALQCGRTNVGGSSLVSVVYHRYESAYAWGSASGCYSETADTTVPELGCVQSSSDAMWRQCQSGAFTAGSTTKPTNCTASYGWCSSATLGRSVPPRTCVQSTGDQQWHQCGANRAWLSAPSAPISGAGPAGSCFAMYGL
ncbi:putative lipoprotein [Myxococcus xanthus DK 1622]|uniref:Lipoprotein n=1 Tax=Myxococcus xanthus (strain DK1622) TaxID=246197 RepID=Q1CYD4_MYXXD|nr:MULTISPECIES: hypothetical protein [Myxococcus]ABF92464.1 putative lipoprotein [Myxococcus xanthus DK 1622]NOJ52324.1 hypothetical protein [Myxococcus xanthus]QPM78801.1 hypothetical protein I5Q59_31870 [Myxococcus xanthus]QVW67872.1 hypothetical protein JTM82_37225 [Myxococcus xanthus DZ2]QZZ54088.1 hypothetical protein MyxoNM_33170 [Myxococcus xanthus]